MLIGDDGRGILIEIGLTRCDGFDIVIHAMRARDRFLR